MNEKDTGLSDEVIIEIVHGSNHYCLHGSMGLTAFYRRLASSLWYTSLLYPDGDCKARLHFYNLHLPACMLYSRTYGKNYICSKIMQKTIHITVWKEAL